MERTHEVHASIRDEALFDCIIPVNPPSSLKPSPGEAKAAQHCPGAQGPLPLSSLKSMAELASFSSHVAYDAPNRARHHSEQHRGPTLSDPMDCSLPGSSIHGIFQARVLEWGAIDKPRQHIKKQRHHFANKVSSSQSYGFSIVVMYG